MWGGGGGNKGVKGARESVVVVAIGFRKEFVVKVR